MIEHKSALLRDIAWRRERKWVNRNVTDEDAKDRRLFQGVDLGCKWKVIAEELDLHPVSEGATFLLGGSAGEQYVKDTIDDQPDSDVD
jgi:hypothetical protein